LTERVNRAHAPDGAKLTTYGYDEADRLEGSTLTRGADRGDLGFLGNVDKSRRA
jgi:hypothetical protein